MELLLIRHALPETEHSGAAGSGVDPPLTMHGRACADLLGQYLAARPDRTPDVVYTSPMRRASETADAITRHAAVSLQTDQRLREFDHGATSYVPPELITPELQARLWRALETGEWGAHRFDPTEFERTVEAAFAAVIAAHPSSVVAVVCHAGVINSFIGRLLDRPRGMFFRPDYTSVSRVLATRGGRRELLTLNETNHLQLAEPRDLSAATAAPESRRP